MLAIRSLRAMRSPVSCCHSSNCSPADFSSLKQLSFYHP
jgi:hypothetical protein